jgi:hypothetical protein
MTSVARETFIAYAFEMMEAVFKRPILCGESKGNKSTSTKPGVSLM